MHAWELQTLNNTAEKHGWHKFISMQDYHSLLYREEERETFPYCKDAGIGAPGCILFANVRTPDPNIGIIPWSPLARGWLARPLEVSKSQPTNRQDTDAFAEMLIGPITKEDEETISRVEALAKKKGVTMAQVSIAWSLKKGVNPILGLSSIKRVDEAVAGVKLAKDGQLTDEDMRYLEEPYIPKQALPV
jgi:aryl-alcohol dehydrogenase-like predicted oxidoreductase